MELFKAHAIALELMEKHGLRQYGAYGCAALYRWEFKFDSARRRFGQCNYSNKTISLSRPLTEINNETEVRDTILHEIAHAIAPLNAHHGPVWKAIARRIGARPEACYSTNTTATITYKWESHCKHCGEKLCTVISFREPSFKVCDPCWKKAKAKGGNYNIGDYTFFFKRVEKIIQQPRASACGPAAVVPVLNPMPAPLQPQVMAAEFSPSRCIEMFKAGKLVVDIAVAMGYARGSGQNRVRNTLIKAGVYNQ